jgi:hypothetical protein
MKAAAQVICLIACADAAIPGIGPHPCVAELIEGDHNRAFVILAQAGDWLAFQHKEERYD